VRGPRSRFEPQARRIIRSRLTPKAMGARGYDAHQSGRGIRLAPLDFQSRSSFRARSCWVDAAAAMGRLPRSIDHGLVYHAFNRGNNRGDVLAEDDDREAFLVALGRTKDRYPFRLYGYCLMSNHFHLLLRPEPVHTISRILQSLTVAHTW